MGETVYNGYRSDYMLIISICGEKAQTYLANYKIPG